MGRHLRDPPPRPVRQNPNAIALAIPLPSPLPRPSLEAQLEAAIRTPPVGRLTRRALLVLGLTLLPLGGWATMTTIEQAVLGQGQLIPEGKRKTVTLLEPGILKRLSFTMPVTGAARARVRMEVLSRRE